MKIYEAIAEALLREDVSTVFAVMGDGNMRTLTYLAGQEGARVVWARHEGSAVAMADGYARATLRLGVSSVTMGPGLTAAATSIVTAARHGSPLLILTGALGQGPVASIQELDHERLAESLGARAITVASPSSALDDLRHAVAMAREESTPVILSVPMDVQTADATVGWPYEPRTPVTAAFKIDRSAVKEAANVLRGAERTLVLAGRGAVEAGAGVELTQLAESLGAGLATTLLAKGLFDGHPNDLGLVGGFGSRDAQEAFLSADCVLAVGASLNRYQTGDGAYFPKAAVVRIDLEAGGASGGVLVRSLIRADALEGARALAKELTPLDERRPWRRAAQADPPAATLPLDALLDPREVMELVNKLLPSNQRFVIGAGHFWWFPITYLHGRPPSRYVFSHDFGSIGQALATGIGVAFGQADPVAVIEGDASIMMHLSELDTAKRYKLPALVLVMNDEGLGAEYHKLRSSGMDARMALIDSPDLAAVARAFGVDGCEASSVKEVEAAVREYLARPRPYLVDLRISREVQSEPYQRYYPPSALQ